jgi:hypothetical protein
MTFDPMKPYDDPEDLPEGVVQPHRFPAHAAKAAGDPPDPKAEAEAKEMAEFQAWKDSQTPQVAPAVDPAYEAWKAEQEAKASSADTVSGVGTEPYDPSKVA